MGSLRYTIDIQAAPSVIYRLLTEREGLLQWIGVDAEVDAVPGGILRWTHENGATMSGSFVELEPFRRIRFLYGWEDSLMGVAPGSTIVEIELIEIEGGTRLELVHDGLPDGVAEAHSAGWTHFLSLLHPTP